VIQKIPNPTGADWQSNLRRHRLRAKEELELELPFRGKQLQFGLIQRSDENFRDYLFLEFARTRDGNHTLQDQKEELLSHSFANKD
jgi:hypothetical protein